MEIKSIQGEGAQVIGIWAEVFLYLFAIFHSCLSTRRSHENKEMACNVLGSVSGKVQDSLWRGLFRPSRDILAVHGYHLAGESSDGLLCHLAFSRQDVRAAEPGDFTVINRTR